MQLTELPDNFYIEDKFYDQEDLLYYIDELIEDFDGLEELPDDFTEKVYKAELKPVYTFEAHELMDLIPEENLPSTELTNSDELEQEIKNIVQKHLDSLNKELPKYWYSTNDYYILTKDEIIKIDNENK